MNIRKGFFRLTIVLSIMAGIIIPIYNYEDFSCKIYEAEEKVFESPKPPKPPEPPKHLPSLKDTAPPGMMKNPFFGTPPVSLKDTIPKVHKLSPHGVVRSIRTVKFKWDKRFELTEGYLKEIFLEKLGKPIGVDIIYSYIILREEDGCYWEWLFGLGIMSFFSVWVIYAFIRWVIVGYVIRGFKVKS